MLELLKTNPYLLFGALGAFTALAFPARSGHFFRTLLFTACTGLGALVAVCWLGAFTGVIICLNPFTIGISAFLGIPGVAGMLLLRIIFLL